MQNKMGKKGLLYIHLPFKVLKILFHSTFINSNSLTEHFVHGVLQNKDILHYYCASHFNKKVGHFINAKIMS